MGLWKLGLYDSELSAIPGSIIDSGFSTIDMLPSTSASSFFFGGTTSKASAFEEYSGSISSSTFSKTFPNPVTQVRGLSRQVCVLVTTG